MLCLVLLCGTAYAAKYPEMGICTGEKVRLRDSPSSKGKIIGLVQPDRNRFVVWMKSVPAGRSGTRSTIPRKRVLHTLQLSMSRLLL